MSSSLRKLAYAALPAAGLAAFGVDISQPLDQNSANCLVQQAGASFFIVRAWCSYGAFDSNAPQSVANAWAAGASHVDVYMFPCASQDPSQQVSSLVSQLSSNGVQYGQIWIDIESNPSCPWSDPATNCAWMQSAVSAMQSNGVNYGTYASSYQWGSIMGSDCSVASGGPLWYPHYDGNPSFSDFSGFGGWSSPAMKQYAGNAVLCGFGVDENWYPDSVSSSANSTVAAGVTLGHRAKAEPANLRGAAAPAPAAVAEEKKA